LPSPADTADSEPPTDEAREALLESIVGDLGSTVLETRLELGNDLWVRVTRESWASVADYFQEEQRCRYFDWLSVIDWKHSPFGRGMDSEVEIELHADHPKEHVVESDHTQTGADGYAGGETRFQVIARVSSLSTGLGINLKADLPDDDLTIDTWTNNYPGASWHEREAFEMFGISFTGHPKMKNLYLPTDFEGFPLRKDFPLVARIVKPWPGIVDVESMPEVEEPESTTPLGATTSNPQDGGVQ